MSKPFLKTENLLTDANGILWRVFSNVLAEIGSVDVPNSQMRLEIGYELLDEFETHREAWGYLNKFTV